MEVGSFLGWVLLDALGPCQGAMKSASGLNAKAIGLGRISAHSSTTQNMVYSGTGTADMFSSNGFLQHVHIGVHNAFP